MSQVNALIGEWRATADERDYWKERAIKAEAMAISVAARSSETAVQLVPDAFPIIYRAYGQPSEALIRRVRHNRTKPYRLSVYLTESEYAAFNAAKGALSTQEWLHALIVRALKGAENA